MKNLMLILIAVLFTALVGCSDSIPVTPTQKYDTLIFTMDKLSISSIESGWVYLISTHTFPCSYQKVKVEFKGYTNLDSTCLMSLYVSGQYRYTNFFSYYVSKPNEINKSHSFIIPHDAKGTYNLNFIVSLHYLSPEIESGLIEFQNIRVYALN